MDDSYLVMLGDQLMLEMDLLHEGSPEQFQLDSAHYAVLMV